MKRKEVVDREGWIILCRALYSQAESVRLSDREVLTHTGKITAVVIQAKAEEEFGVFQQRQLVAPSHAEQDFEAALGKQVKAIEQVKRIGKKGRGKAE